MEQTFVMLKPDTLKRGLIGEIVSRIEKKGYMITRMETKVLSQDLLEEHYSHIADQPFFPEVVEFMTSGPVIAMIVEGVDVVKGIRILMGATKFEDALPGTIRGDYAFTTSENLIHGSDCSENAVIEIKRFFG